MLAIRRDAFWWFLYQCDIDNVHCIQQKIPENPEQQQTELGEQRSVRTVHFFSSSNMVISNDS